MKRWSLGLVLLLGMAVSTASADYVVIVANLGQGNVRMDPLLVRQQPTNPQLQTNPNTPRFGGPIGGQPPLAPPAGAPPGAPPGQPGAPGAAQPPAAKPFDPDAVPLLIIAVVEVDRKLKTQDIVQLAFGQPIDVKFKVGSQTGRVFLANTSISSVTVLHPPDAKDKRRAPEALHVVYENMVKKLKDSKPPATADQWVDLAEWCLGHGMLDQFKLHMDAAAGLDKANPKVDGYLKIKAALAKPVQKTDVAGPWRLKLLSTRYQTATSAHYALLHNTAPAADARLRRLEDAFQSKYYWFALQGKQLPVPQERLLAILTADERDFRHLNQVLDSSPIVSDSFFARRENIAVFSARRLDDAYDRLEKRAAPLWGQGFNREQLLKGKGFPPAVAITNRPLVYEAMTLALLLKVLEQDAEVSGTAHGATRQLIYASGSLPRAVEAPEWFQFGVGTFFETSPGSPWPTVGLPSFEYLPVFRDLVTYKKLPEDRVELLRQVVTDGFFRNPESGVKKEAALRKARATAWSLTYFLMRKRLDGLQRYYQELGQMPRDLTLDESVLWLAFARAFGAVDAAGQPDLQALGDLAAEWEKDMRLDQYDNRETDLMREIRLAYKEAATRQLAPPPPGTPLANQPGAPPPGAPAGAPPGGGRAGRLGGGVPVN